MEKNPNRLCNISFLISPEALIFHFCFEKNYYSKRVIFVFALHNSKKTSLFMVKRPVFLIKKTGLFEMQLRIILIQSIIFDCQLLVFLL